MSSYIMPTGAWLTNPDEHTIQINDVEQGDSSLDVTVNQTTAIRIDDSTTHHRETWSSEKIANFYDGVAKVQFGTVAQWAEQPLFVPNDKEFIVFIDRTVVNDVPYAGIKIGDGISLLSDIPFVGDDIAQSILTELRTHTNNDGIHVTTANKTFWDGKLNYAINGEILEFTRS